jgi:hypothetical protein
MGGIAKGLGTPSISNSSGLPGCSPGWNCQDPELRDDEQFQTGTANKTGDFWPFVKAAEPHFSIQCTLTPIRYFSSDHITT